MELYLNKELCVEQTRGRIKGCAGSTRVYVLGGGDRVAVANAVSQTSYRLTDILTKLEELQPRQS